MSLFFVVYFKEIIRLGRRYPFPRPPNCLREGCKSRRLWGHGYIEAYFEGYEGPISLRRYRCRDCGRVYTIRPFGYWPRHHVEVRIIIQRLCKRIKAGKWDKSDGLTRQRQGQWLRALKKNIMAYLGMSFRGSITEGFYELMYTGRIPVQRA
ncbi:MAG: hypothetical protein GXP46_10595 [Deferribacteres bacterium]|nr:hypothetical protein [Deferribacteres bacterium]